jgi:hypothetical protein
MSESPVRTTPARTKNTTTICSKILSPTQATTLLTIFFLIFARRVIFGMLIALPITLVYYILLGL